MKLEQTFEVQAPLAHVWEALIDLERVAPCLPGAAITGHDEDGTYHGTFSVKLGPMTAAYNGTVRVEDVDEASHTATLKARGTDKRGQGGANATIVNRLSEHDGATRVQAETDFTITGRLAQFGRGGIMEDVSNRLMRDFATCLSSRLGEPPAAETAAPSGAEVTAGDAAPEAVAAAATPEPGAPSGAEVTAGDAAPEAVAAAAAPEPGAPSGAEVTAGDAAPEEVAAAAPTPSTPPPSVTPPPAATPPAAAPVKGFSLFFSVLWERIRRLFGRPA